MTKYGESELSIPCDWVRMSQQVCGLVKAGTLLNTPPGTQKRRAEAPHFPLLPPFFLHRHPESRVAVNETFIL